MKFYHIVDPRDYTFAIAGRRGTWSQSPQRGFCEGCGMPLQVRIPPLILEWESGSDLIGDFTFPGFGDEVVVQDRVRQVLSDQGWNIEFLPVEMTQERRLKRPSRPNKRSRPRVWLPYEGPPLWDMQPQTFYRLDIQRSGLKLERTCGVCGEQIYKRPPLEGRYLVIPRDSFTGAHVFQIQEYAGLPYCTEQAKEMIEQHGFTNVTFRLDGEIDD